MVIEVGFKDLSGKRRKKMVIGGFLFIKNAKIMLILAILKKKKNICREKHLKDYKKMLIVFMSREKLTIKCYDS